MKDEDDSTIEEADIFLRPDRRRAWFQGKVFCCFEDYLNQKCGKKIKQVEDAKAFLREGENDPRSFEIKRRDRIVHRGVVTGGYGTLEKNLEQLMPHRLVGCRVSTKWHGEWWYMGTITLHERQEDGPEGKKNFHRLHYDDGLDRTYVLHERKWKLCALLEPSSRKAQQEEREEQKEQEDAPVTFVTLVLRDGSRLVRAKRALEASSPVWACALSEEGEGEIELELENYEAAGVRAALAFSDGVNMEMNRESLGLVLHAHRFALAFQLEACQRECERQMAVRMGFGTCVEIFCYLFAMRCPGTPPHLVLHARLHCLFLDEIYQTAGFAQKMTRPALVSLLQDPDLVVSSEDIVLASCTRWLDERMVCDEGVIRLDQLSPFLRQGLCRRFPSLPFSPSMRIHNAARKRPLTSLQLLESDSLSKATPVSLPFKI